MRRRALSESLSQTLRAGLIAAAAVVLAAPAHARIDGVPVGSGVSLVATDGYIYTADGEAVYTWGYGTLGMQYPGPTLIKTGTGDFTISLTNYLPLSAGATSIVVPGMELVSVEGGVAGPIAQEAPTGQTITYTFHADRPGTYLYHSASRPELQVEMGLSGAIIVRPDGFAADLSGRYPAYDPADTASAAYTSYDREYLFFLTEMDPDIHLAVEEQKASAQPVQVDLEPYHPVYWFINGRGAPDTMIVGQLQGGAGFPNQPYGALPWLHPGERILLRMVGAGRQQHPLHLHGNFVRVLARDANVIKTAANGHFAGTEEATVLSVPGQTVDMTFEWTGKGLGWDAYGHTNAGDGLCTPGSDGYNTNSAGVPYEWCEDHGKPIPVELPEGLQLAWGGFYGGSPFLGQTGNLPVGEGGLNPWGAFTFPWHSHAEKELTNNDVFPGGMLTFVFVMPRCADCDLDAN